MEDQPRLAPMAQTALSIQSHGLALEGVIATPRGAQPPLPGVVLCPGHTVFGGRMDSPLMVALAQEVVQRGFSCLRFNFRGVGSSEGQFTNGEAEHLDVAAALELMGAFPGVARSRLAVVGHSFGASVVLAALKEMRGPRAFAFLSPPLSAVQKAPIAKDKRPKLFVVGQGDRIVPSQRLQNELQGMPGPLTFKTVAGADHAYAHREQEVARIVADYLAIVL